MVWRIDDHGKITFATNAKSQLVSTWQEDSSVLFSLAVYMLLSGIKPFDLLIQPELLETCHDAYILHNFLTGFLYRPKERSTKADQLRAYNAEVFSAAIVLETLATKLGYPNPSSSIGELPYPPGMQPDFLAHMVVYSLIQSAQRDISERFIEDLMDFSLD
jgi:hypothetical protein